MEPLLLAAAALFPIGVLVLEAMLAPRGLLGFLRDAGLPLWMLPLVSLLTVAILFISAQTAGVATARARSAADGLHAALTALLSPHLRREINARVRVSFDTLDVRQASGLAETVDPSLEVPTSARAELSALMRRMGSGAIGISGSRGAGKSTLIRAACGGRLALRGGLPTEGVSISAPVRWEANEFVPLLFAELCKSVAPGLGEEEGSSWTPRDLLVGYVACGLVVGMALLATRVADGTVKLRAEHVEAAAIGLGAAILLAVSLPLLLRGLLGMPRLARSRPPFGPSALRRSAERCLRELRFRETVVRGWSLGTRAPLGVSLSRKRELSATRQPLTLPEVVSRYKAFVRQVAATRALVIGIDELDKMSSAEEAARFLGDVKVLFGEQPCFYLVSVSDDAMSEFERRGVPLRTVFDSTFDDVLHVETLSFPEARAIANGRVVGMGDGHIALCYVLGDGVPRELIRFIRGAIEASNRGARTPPEVARTLGADRQRRIERAAAAVAAQHVATRDVHPLLEWLDALPAPSAETLALRWDVAAPYVAIGEHVAPAPERDRQRALLLELAAVAYRAATTIALADELDENVLEATTREHEPTPVLALLARAGRDLGRGPRRAWQTVDAAREEMGMERVPFPLDGAPAAENARDEALWRRLLATALALR